MGPLMRQFRYIPVNSCLKRSSNSIRGRSETWRGDSSALRESDRDGGVGGKGRGAEGGRRGGAGHRDGGGGCSDDGGCDDGVTEVGAATVGVQIINAAARIVES